MLQFIVHDVLLVIFDYLDYKTLLKIEGVSKYFKTFIYRYPTIFHYKHPTTLYIDNYDVDYEITNLLIGKVGIITRRISRFIDCYD